MFVNTGCTVFQENPGNGEDFDVATQQQTAQYEITGEGNDVYLVLPAQTQFPYISCDNQYNTPKFRIESITGSKLVLVYDDGTIAWHYILTSKAEEQSFDGFDPDSDYNMFKNCTYTNEFFYAPGWAQIADPTLTANGNSFTIDLPVATSEKWQAQVKFLTDMSTSAASNYDFSCKLMSNTNHNNVTVKLVKTGIAAEADVAYDFSCTLMSNKGLRGATVKLTDGANDADNFFFTERVDLAPYEEYVLKVPASKLAIGASQGLMLVLDFGGCQDNTTVTVNNIVLQKTAQ